MRGTSLFIQLSSGEIEIKTREDYFMHGLSQALRYLPEKYVNHFIRPFEFKKLPIVDKIIIPQIERLTGSIWRMLGFATYHQVKQETERLNEKIDEIADPIKATFENSVKIIQQVQEINDHLNNYLGII